MSARQLRDKYPPQKTQNAKPKTKWVQYEACETCKAKVGKPCISMHSYPRYTEYVQNPHPGRRKHYMAND